MASPTARAKPKRRARWALRQFATLLDNGTLSGDRAADAEVERGKLYYQMGERDQAMAAFRRAADLGRGDPESGSPGHAFIDMLAFLVPRGELDEAVSISPRTGRAAASEHEGLLFAVDH